MSVDVRCKVGQRVDLLENKSVYFAVECDIITYKVFKAANSYFNEVFKAANNYFNEVFKAANNYSLFFSSEIKVVVCLRT